MSADYIPFVSTEKDCEILKKFYPDPMRIRVSLEKRDQIADRLPPAANLWLDGAVDGIHIWDPEEVRSKIKKKEKTRLKQYNDYIMHFPGCEKIRDSNFQKRPDYEVVKEFVRSVMDKCCDDGSRNPDWLSIPQLPMVKNNSRNKINQSLAEAAGKWRADNSFTGKMILPVILTHQDQVHLKKGRKGPLSEVERCYKLAGAAGVWVTETSLNDQEGSKPLSTKRFPGLIQFHQELNELLPDAITVAGPYWGMNLVLWARGLVRYPAISLGTAYKYYIPGVSFPSGSAHAAIPPLKRWVAVSREFQTWLKESLPRIPRQERAYAELEALLRGFQVRGFDKEYWRTQVAKFYKDWLNELTAVPTSGRALALYQQLSSAYVLGRSLRPLPPDEKSAKRPEKVAEQLMLSCL